MNADALADGKSNPFQSIWSKSVLLRLVAVLPRQGVMPNIPLRPGTRLPHCRADEDYRKETRWSWIIALAAAGKGTAQAGNSSFQPNQMPVRSANPMVAGPTCFAADALYAIGVAVDPFGFMVQRTIEKRSS